MRTAQKTFKRTVNKTLIITERILGYFLEKLDSRIVKVAYLWPGRYLYYYNSGIVNNPRVVFLNHFRNED